MIGPLVTGDEFVLKIVINSMIEDSLEVRRASLKALGAVLNSSDPLLMETLVNYGFLENITTVIIGATD